MEDIDEHLFLEELLAPVRDGRWELDPPESFSSAECDHGSSFAGYFHEAGGGVAPCLTAFENIAIDVDPESFEICCPLGEAGFTGSEHCYYPFEAAMAFTGSECDGIGGGGGGPPPSSSLVAGDPPPAPERIRKKKRAEGAPSKNLMAERRRRKRLNDRLSMLRSVVPKISKMDRTSILGDTVDYMKELLERIQRLKEMMMEEDEQQQQQRPRNLLGAFFKNDDDALGRGTNDIYIRNSPKFEVERMSTEGAGETMKVSICCASKPGLLLSTVGALDSMGLEIKQCVVSCFNDFGMQASCSSSSAQLEEEKTEQGRSCEEIKQALFRNAGYGGRCP